MAHISHKMLLASIRAVREEALREVAALAEEDFTVPPAKERWAEIQRLLLRFGDHMREHANQIEGTRAALQRAPTDIQRTLQEAELAWGKLLAALVDLSDEDCRRIPADDGWSIEEILQHILTTERRSLEAIRIARRK
jgi:hypothetical protein